MTTHEELQRSKLIASLLGPLLVAVTVSEAINLHIWKTNIPQVVYLNGMLLFTAGLVVVRFHNLWRRNWVVVITLVGWALLFAGLLRLFFPAAQQADDTPLTYPLIVSLCLLGCFLSAKAYR